jgi:hypothetical protein
MEVCETMKIPLRLLQALFITATAPTGTSLQFIGTNYVPFYLAE